MNVNQKIMLDAGCGSNCQPGFIGMDKRKLEGVQIVHDLEEFPWPLPFESCAVVVLSHVVEHIKPWFQIDLLNEIWRILEPKGQLLISTPYGGSFRYNQDPTHCSPWNQATPYYFVPAHHTASNTTLYEVYEPKPWSIKGDKVYFDPYGDLEVCLVKEEEDA